MDTLIKVTHNTVYGVDRFYPANKLAESLTELCRQSTLTKEQLQYLKDTGFTVEIVTKPIELK